jgi:DNA-binding IclR family transcriptional regulator
MDVKKDVKTAGRTLSLFEAFYNRKAPMTLTQLASALDAPISSCHALVRTLSARGYLYTAEQTRSIYPTKRLLEIAREIADHDPILGSVGPILADLRDSTGETVLLGRRQDDGVLYLEVIEGSHTVRYSARSGDIKPLHSSAIGKALLGRLDPAALADTLSRLDMARYTPHTIVDKAVLQEDLRRSQDRGTFITRGENVVDVMAIAITAMVNDEVLGVALAGPLSRMANDEAGHSAHLLATRDILETLGGAAAQPAVAAG